MRVCDNCHQGAGEKMVTGSVGFDDGEPPDDVANGKFEYCSPCGTALKNNDFAALAKVAVKAKAPTVKRQGGKPRGRPPRQTAPAPVAAGTAPDAESSPPRSATELVDQAKRNAKERAKASQGQTTQVQSAVTSDQAGMAGASDDRDLVPSADVSADVSASADDLSDIPEPTAADLAEVAGDDSDSDENDFAAFMDED